MANRADPVFSGRTITALAYAITGDRLKGKDAAIAPYRSGPQLVRFFNEHGANDSYSQGFPSRFTFAEEKLRSFNGTKAIIGITEAAADVTHFFDEESTVEGVTAYLNQYLKREGFELILLRDNYKLRRVGEQLVELDAAMQAADALTQEFIVEQMDKCRLKLRDEDFDGAITNARSLIEAVLLDIEHRLTGVVPTPDGDLPRQFKTVQKLLNLDPSRKDISNSLRQVLTGLVSIVAGIAPLRNRMSDAHARSYKPARHHAKLAINAAQTVVDFLFETFEYQLRQGLIAELPTAVRNST